METERFKIYIDRLKNGHIEKIKETIEPSALSLETDQELSFPQEIQFSCEAYLADDHLILHFSIVTALTLCCSICNEPVLIPINIQGHYSSIALDEIRTTIYDMGSEIRDTILLHTPLFTECNTGNCPERPHLEQFLKPTDPTPTPPNVVHFPFSHLT